MAAAPANIDYNDVLGMFREESHGKYFEYIAATEDEANVFNNYSPYDGPNFPHRVFVGPLGWSRAARVLGTVAYVVVDEDDNGPVVEKWNINHKVGPCFRRG
jgi:hypothetical protein